MNRTLLSMATAMALVAGVAAPSFAADLKPQPMSKVDVTTLADGFRSSKMIGSGVTNDQQETIGKVDDLLVGRSDKVLYAVISVGGFLGVGSKLVAVPYDALQIGKSSLVLPNGTKEELKNLPEFKYASS
ncbi:MAG TPA: PRC-barrel domain-containing protein [Alphaproteobacteria bacterium]|jgi:hypothetical protein|nr:PRC-barrel domain-containing protein [Alphaproteobacteria bacterium]